MKEENQKLTAEIVEKTNKVTELVGTINNLNLEKEVIETNIEQYKKIEEKAKEDARIAKEQAENNIKDKEAVRKKIVDAEVEYASVLTKKTTAEKDIKTLEAEYETTKKNNDDKLAQSEIDAKQKIAKLTEDISNYKKTLEAISAGIDQEKKNLAELVLRETSLKEVIKNLELTIKGNEEVIAILKKEESRVRQSINELELDKIALIKAVSDKSVELEGIEKDILDARAELPIAQAEYEEVKNKTAEMNKTAFLLSKKASHLNQQEEYIKRMYVEAGVPYTEFTPE